MARIVSIISGKSGVGKTTLAINLSLGLAAKGRRPCLLSEISTPGGGGLPPDILPRPLPELVNAGPGLSNLVSKAVPGVDIVPLTPTVDSLNEVSPSSGIGFGQALVELGDYDFYILDLAARTRQAMVAGSLPAPETLVVATPESKSLAATYEMVKALTLNGYKKRLNFLINQGTNPKRAEDAYRKLRDPIAKYLNINLDSLGVVPLDPEAQTAVDRGVPMGILFPQTPGYRAILAVADRLIDWGLAVEIPNPGLYFEKFFTKLTGPLKLTYGSGKEGPRAKVPPAPTVSKPLAPRQLAGGEMEALLGTLAHSMAAISQELAGIRKILEEKGNATVAPEGGDAYRDTHGEEIVSLDFEAFLAEKSDQKTS